MTSAGMTTSIIMLPTIIFSADKWNERVCDCSKVYRWNFIEIYYIYTYVYLVSKNNTLLYDESSPRYHACTDWLKCVDVEIALNFGNCFRTFQGGFLNFILELCFFTSKFALYLFLFLTGPVDLAKPRALNSKLKSSSTSKFQLWYLILSL